MPYDRAMSNTPPEADPVELIERARIRAHELSWAMREVTRTAIDVDFTLARRLRLRPIEYAAMNHVMTARGTLGPRELGDRLGISSGSATELVDRLEQAGHLQRHRDLADRRRVSLHATPRVVSDVLRQLRPLLDGLDAVASDVPPEEQAAIQRYLRAASRVMRDYTQT